MKLNTWFDVLTKVSLFSGIDELGINTMLQCIGAETINVLRGEFVLFVGDKITHIGIVLSGELHIMSECFEGKRSLIASLAPSDIYAEALCCANIEESPISVIAKTDSTVLLLDFSYILSPCSNVCGFHKMLIGNMLKNVAMKNLQLQSRMEILSMKSVRSKVLRYLESFVSKQGQHIVIPFNREELASYLSVERSALSHELARMKADGLIDYKKNHFHLKKNIHLTTGVVKLELPK